MKSVKLSNGVATIRDYIDVETDYLYNLAMYDGVGLETEVKDVKEENPEEQKDGTTKQETKKSSKFPMINTLKANRVLVEKLLVEIKVDEKTVEKITPDVINKLRADDYYKILAECEKIWKKSQGDDEEKKS